MQQNRSETNILCYSYLDIGYLYSDTELIDESYSLYGVKLPVPRGQFPAPPVIPYDTTRSAEFGNLYLRFSQQFKQIYLDIFFVHFKRSFQTSNRACFFVNFTKLFCHNFIIFYKCIGSHFRLFWLISSASLFSIKDRFTYNNFILHSNQIASVCKSILSLQVLNIVF